MSLWDVSRGDVVFGASWRLTSLWLYVGGRPRTTTPQVISQADVLELSNKSVIAAVESTYLSYNLTLPATNVTNLTWAFSENDTVFDFDNGDGVADVAIMVSTATALALVILATVIGKFFHSFTVFFVWKILDRREKRAERGKISAAKFFIGIDLFLRNISSRLSLTRCCEKIFI